MPLWSCFAFPEWLAILSMSPHTCCPLLFALKTIQCFEPLFKLNCCCGRLFKFAAVFCVLLLCWVSSLCRIALLMLACLFILLFESFTAQRLPNAAWLNLSCFAVVACVLGLIQKGNGDLQYYSYIFPSNLIISGR